MFLATPLDILAHKIIVQRQWTFLTAFLQLVHQRKLTFMTNLTDILAQTQSIPSMCSCGGQSKSIFIHAYHTWHWTISWSPVCEISIYPLILLSNANFLLATSINVKCVFSKGWILLSHVCNQLSVQLTCAMMCLGAWGLMGYVRDCDTKAVTILPDLKDGKKEDHLADD